MFRAGKFTQKEYMDKNLREPQVCVFFLVPSSYSCLWLRIDWVKSNVVGLGLITLLFVSWVELSRASGWSRLVKG